MTVIEREFVEVEAPITEREQRARTLEAAALEIDYRGWGRGLPHSGDGPTCLLGAAAVALGKDPSWWVSDDVELLWSGKVSRDYPDIERAWNFNDNLAESAEEVKFVLRWRAAEVRDGR